MTAWLDDVIDVSDAQGVVDWPAVAAAGIKVAMIKATEGHTFAAKTFVVNREGALATGLITPIAYDFLRPGYEAESLAFFTKVAGIGPGSLTMLDWEGRASDTCTPQEIEDIGNAILERSGRLPLGYWAKTGATPRPPTAEMQTWPRVIPAYPQIGAKAFTAVPHAYQINPLLHWPGALFAQYTCWGIVSGVKGPVDRSVWIGTAAERAAWLKDGTMPARFT